jgi:hypothetical protein
MCLKGIELLYPFTENFRRWLQRKRYSPRNFRHGNVGTPQAAAPTGGFRFIQARPSYGLLFGASVLATWSMMRWISTTCMWIFLATSGRNSVTKLSIGAVARAVA